MSDFWIGAELVVYNAVLVVQALLLHSTTKRLKSSQILYKERQSQLDAMRLEKFDLSQENKRLRATLAAAVTELSKASYG